MKNLKTLIKESYFKPELNIIATIIVILVVTFMWQLLKSEKENNEIDKLKIIKDYQKQIQVKDSLYKIKESTFVYRIDSLETIKNKIIIKYDEKIKAINSASANDHAKWLESKVDSLQIK